MPSFCRPNIARRTPKTCPAQRWPCACSASRRYSSRDFTNWLQLSVVSFQLNIVADDQMRTWKKPRLAKSARSGAPQPSLLLSALLSAPADSVFGDFYEDAGFREFSAEGV